MAVKLGSLTLDLVTRIAGFTEPLDRAERHARNSSRSMVNSFDAASHSLQNLAVAFGGMITVSAAIAKMDSYTGLQNRLKLVTDSQAELNKAMQDTFTIAQATGNTWDSTAMVYQRFAQNADRLNITMAETAGLTETVSKAIAISGGSAASAEAALVQFGQALASGVLRGEEFNSISEQAPGLLNAIAQGLNVNIGQLRAMAGEGKLTADVVVESLEKAKVSVDDLFSKTDFTIGNSFTMLNNAITQFVGEAGKGSGAATIMSESIQLVAHNFDTLVNVGMVAAVFWGGTYIPVMYKSIGATVGRVAAMHNEIEIGRLKSAQDLKMAQTQLVNTQATLRAIVAEKALEVERMKAQISAQGRIASATRMAGLRRVETQVTAELTAAENALAAARTRSAAAGSVVATAGRGALAVLGGPVGLGVMAATVAAGYLLMRDNTASANKELARNAEYANLAREELQKLDGAQRRAAVEGLEKAFAAQNKELQDANFSFNSAAIAIQNYTTQNHLGYEAQVKVRNITNDVLRGVISQEEAIKRYNQLDFVTTEQIRQLGDTNRLYEEKRIAAQKSADALGYVGKQTEMAGNAASNAAGKIRQNTDEMDQNASAADKAAEAQKKYQQTLSDRRYDAKYLEVLIDQYGFSEQKAREYLKAQIDLGRTRQGINQDTQQGIELTLEGESRVNNLLEQRKKLLESQKKFQDEARKKREDDAKKAKENAKKNAEDGKRLLYEYGGEVQRIETDLADATRRINAAILPVGSDRSQMLAEAKSISEGRKKLYFQENVYSLNSWKWSESQKLAVTKDINKLRIDVTMGMSNAERKLHKQSVDDQYQYELDMLRLSQKQQLLEYQRHHLTQLEFIRRTEALKREEIEKTLGLTDDERKAKLDSLQADTDSQINNIKTTSLTEYITLNAELNGTSEYQNLQNEFDGRMEILKSNLEAENITIAQFLEERARITESYNQAEAALNLTYSEQITGSMTEMFGTMFGEQTGIYKAMFAANKAFAIAQSMVSIQQGIAQAAANPFPYNLAAMATVAASTASIISNIQGVAGVFHGGTNYVPKEASYLLDQGERVISPRQNQDLTRYLNRNTDGNQASGDVIIHNYGADVQYQQNSDGDLEFDVRVQKVIDRYFPDAMANPGSKIHKSVVQNTTAGTKRTH